MTNNYNLPTNANPETWGFLIDKYFYSAVEGLFDDKYFLELHLIVQDSSNPNIIYTIIITLTIVEIFSLWN